MRNLLIIGILLLALVSGCVQQEGTTGMTTSELEDQAAGMIEQELENAVENIDISDIEGEITG